MKKLLHIVDMQNDFVRADGALAVRGADALIRPANDFLVRAKFGKTIATFDTHRNATYARSGEGRMFPMHCAYGTKGWKSAINMPQYQPITKSVFDVWANPRKLEAALREWDPDDTSVYVFGVASDFCVKYAIAGYLARGYDVTVISDLCRGIERQIEDVAAEFNNPKLCMTTTKGFINEGR